MQNTVSDTSSFEMDKAISTSFRLSIPWWKAQKAPGIIPEGSILGPKAESAETSLGCLISNIWLLRHTHWQPHHAFRPLHLDTSLIQAILT
jgi:hypothetical protein